MRSLEDARERWPELDNFHSLANLKESINLTNTVTSTAVGLRSVCWKVFLLFETVDRATWSGTLADSRAAYDSLRAHFLRAIEHPDEVESAADPLSDNQESPWTLLRQDEALRAEIFQDVERCMPDNVYFRQPLTQNILLNVLFIFAKLNSDVGYRQGMHEVLAPILWVVERDSVDAARYNNATKELGDEGLLEMFDSCYIEHDTFTLFGLVMQNAKSFYEPGAQTRAGTRPSQSAPHTDSPMLTRCRRIFEGLLPRVDPGLAAHLNEIGVLPQLFLMRWIRVLFGREFPFNDVLPMWDLLFAEDSTLELVDYVCVAMLLRLRWQLINADNSAALYLLNHYPEQSPSQRPQTFVEDALYLRQHLGTDGANHVLARRSQRPIQLINRIEQTELRRSQLNSFNINSRPISPVLKLPDRSTSQSGSLEALFQGAARDLYNRGEKLGFNQAIRDAVGEVKKNVQGGLQSVRSPHQVKSPAPSILESADVVSKIEAFERRNKELGKMLAGAVTELWDYHREQAEEKKKEQGPLKALSLAIARVQFVQVCLEDNSIPLPAEDQAETPGSQGDDSGSTELLRPKSPFKKTPARPSRAARYRQTRVSSSERPPTHPSPSPSPSASQTPQSSERQQPSLPGTSTTTTPRQPAPSDNVAHSGIAQSAPAAVEPTKKSLTLPTRPPIAQSSFSWMLGQDATSPSSNSRSTFIAASPFQSEKRRSAAAGKGFLFGEEDEEDSGGGGKKKGKTKGKGKGMEEEEGEEGEIFSLGTLRGGRGR